MRWAAVGPNTPTKPKTRMPCWFSCQKKWDIRFAFRTNHQACSDRLCWKSIDATQIGTCEGCDAATAFYFAESFYDVVPNGWNYKIAPLMSLPSECEPQCRSSLMYLPALNLSSTYLLPNSPHAHGLEILDPGQHTNTGCISMRTENAGSVADPNSQSRNETRMQM